MHDIVQSRTGCGKCSLRVFERADRLGRCITFADEHTLVVLGPEHARTIADSGWGKAEMRDFLWTRLRKPVRALIPGVEGGEGLPAHVLAKFAAPATEETLIASVDRHRFKPASVGEFRVLSHRVQPTIAKALRRGFLGYG